ncbi:aspartyl-phosphate phosphatase Spo0E family protein [Litchfieldia salsa]|uniref:Spo0E like sporulation regulatory protein n=1 Tax=Litchfieldia salsa TaxID=930152 RepID=A0A1H0WM83_9BACI|nr:aspartyl-phosphate phosphatase Spo0E family protein [Litchfieldia salsa]SDP91738.1 Spo0E like sporulation regulatory protein [Litchfieldia salsa]
MSHSISTSMLINERAFLLEIELLRMDLVEVGVSLGLNHPYTLYLSQTLDTLIIDYQRYCSIT